MDIFTKIFILALVSLHQYVPREQMAEKYFETAVNPYNLAVNMDSRTLVASAHQTCRFLMLKSQQELDTDEQQLVNFLFTMIDEKADSIVQYGSTPATLKKTIRDVCRADFNWTAFPSEKLAELNTFLNTEVAILKGTDLMTFGDWGLFGQTSLYDRNGTYLGSLYPSMDRWVPLAQISPNVPKALIATEDKTFLKHQGVDLSSLVRILMQMKSSDSASGGSTLTMQILKNFYLKDREFVDTSTPHSYRSLQLLRKIREWFWAKPFEVYLSQDNSVSAKDKILEYYLNLMDYGPNIRGIGQASSVFFGKTADQLTIADAAFLAALFKAPSRYSSPANYETIPGQRAGTRSRRAEVLSEMKELTREETGLLPISSAEENQALQEALPQWTRPQVTSLFPSEAIYLQTHAKDFISDVTSANPQILPIEPEMISSIDMNLQDVVHNAVRRKLDEYDSNRYNKNRIFPARDDRTDIADLRSEDVTSEANNLLEDYIEQHPQLNIDVIVKIKRGSSLELSEIYFSPQNNILHNKEDLNDLVGGQSDIEKVTALRQAQILLIATNPEGCTSPASIANGTASEMELLTIPKPCLRILENNEALQNLLTTVRQKITLQYLQRVTSYAPRPNIQAAYLDPLSDDLLIVQKDADNNPQLRSIRLSTGHFGLNHRDFFAQQVNSGAFKRGQMFWVALASNQQTFYLETPKLQAAAVVMDSHTGEVYAHFGGYDPASSRYFDRSTMAMRQPGSTLKPWIYYLALTKGFSADSVIDNAGVRFAINENSTYVPDNFGNAIGPAQMRLSDAFKNSYNKAAVGLLLDPRFGPDRFTNLDEFINLLTDVELFDSATVQDRPSIVLGAQEVSLINLVSSFTFFANGQHIVKPTFFRSVKTGQGIPLYLSEQPQTIEVPHSQDRTAVHGIQRLLLDVANSGTGAALKGFPSQLGLSQCAGQSFGVNGQVCFGGKTGTSSLSNDNWFIGTSRNFVIGVWIGYDFREPTGSTGGALALPVFMDIIQQGHEFLPPIEPLINE